MFTAIALLLSAQVMPPPPLPDQTAAVPFGEAGFAAPMVETRIENTSDRPVEVTWTQGSEHLTVTVASGGRGSFRTPPGLMTVIVAQPGRNAHPVTAMIDGTTAELLIQADGTITWSSVPGW